MAACWLLCPAGSLGVCSDSSIELMMPSKHLILYRPISSCLLKVLRNDWTVPTATAHFTSPPAMCKIPMSPEPHKQLVTFNVFGSCHLNKYQEVTWFTKLFPWGGIMLTVFHVLIDYLHTWALFTLNHKVCIFAFFTSRYFLIFLVFSDFTLFFLFVCEFPNIYGSPSLPSTCLIQET